MWKSFFFHIFYFLPTLTLRFLPTFHLFPTYSHLLHFLQSFFTNPFSHYTFTNHPFHHQRATCCYPQQITYFTLYRSPQKRCDSDHIYRYDSDRDGGVSHTVFGVNGRGSESNKA